MNLLAKVTPTEIIILSVVMIAQYLAALLALYKLIRSGMPLMQTLFWNLIALFIFFIGPAVAVVIAGKYKKQHPPKPVPAVTAPPARSGGSAAPDVQEESEGPDVPGEQDVPEELDVTAKEDNEH